MRIDSFASTFCSAFQHEVISDNLTVIRPFNLFFSLGYTINLSKYSGRHWQHFYIAMRKIMIIRRVNRAYDDFSLLDIFWTRINSKKEYPVESNSARSFCEILSISFHSSLIFAFVPRLYISTSLGLGKFWEHSQKSQGRASDETFSSP